MRFEASHHVPHAPPERTLAHWRLATPHLAGRIPTISAIETLEEDGDTVRLKWFGHGELPRAARAVVKPEDVYWIDETTWDAAALEARTVITRPGFDSIRSTARVRFRSDGNGGTRVDVTGELKIGLPLIGALLERFFISHVKNDLKRTLVLLGEDLE